MARRRNSLRHPQYDYTQPGAYFITICAKKGKPIFGQIVDGRMQYTPLGEIARQVWDDLSTRHPHIEVEIFVVMPNHVHALIWIRTQVGEAGTARSYGKPVAGSLSVLINAYKTAVTKRASQADISGEGALWQRNFYDRIVRDEQELAYVKEYIRMNPYRWQEDQLHPDAPPNQFNRW